MDKEYIYQNDLLNIVWSILMFCCIYDFGVMQYELSLIETVKLQDQPVFIWNHPIWKVMRRILIL